VCHVAGLADTVVEEFDVVDFLRLLNSGQL
jgi:hypothetical protein